jgi:tripartite-type tricarboxylate transporter receptor subunit TctC
LRAGLITPLYVYAATRPPELSDVPSMIEFARNDDERVFLQIYALGPSIGRSLAAPPSVPKERVKLLRAAMMQMLDDPEFKAAVRKANIPLDPLDGEALATQVAKVVGLPASTIASAREFYDRLLAVR